MVCTGVQTSQIISNLTAQTLLWPKCFHLYLFPCPVWGMAKVLPFVQRQSYLLLPPLLHQTANSSILSFWKGSKDSLPTSQLTALSQKQILPKTLTLQLLSSIQFSWEVFTQCLTTHMLSYSIHDDLLGHHYYCLSHQKSQDTSSETHFLSVSLSLQYSLQASS